MYRMIVITWVALLFGLMPISSQFVMASAANCGHGTATHEMTGHATMAKPDCGNHHQKQQLPCNMGGNCASTACTAIIASGTAVAMSWTAPDLAFVILPTRAPHGQHLLPLEEPPRAAA